jgi:hypothetical protein
MNWVALVLLIAGLWCVVDLLLVGIWISAARWLRSRRDDVLPYGSEYLARTRNVPMLSHRASMGMSSRQH